MRFWLVGWVGVFLSLGILGAAESRGELLFQASAALKTGNRTYFERCFALDGADATARGQAKAIIDEILRWSDPIVELTERAADANAEEPKLNGEWAFQIHFTNGQQARQAYVFPAGPVGDGAVKVLLLAR